MKRTRSEEDDTIPEGWKTTAPNKKLKKMLPEDDSLDLNDWWNMVEGGCLRFGILRRRLDEDRARVLRMMEVMDTDRILSDSQE